jgi:hypothetical protein
MRREAAGDAGASEIGRGPCVTADRCRQVERRLRQPLHCIRAGLECRGWSRRGEPRRPDRRGVPSVPRVRPESRPPQLRQRSPSLPNGNAWLRELPRGTVAVASQATDPADRHRCRTAWPSIEPPPLPRLPRNRRLDRLAGLEREPWCGTSASPRGGPVRPVAPRRWWRIPLPSPRSDQDRTTRRILPIPPAQTSRRRSRRDPSRRSPAMRARSAVRIPSRHETPRRRAVRRAGEPTAAAHVATTAAGRSSIPPPAALERGVPRERAAVSGVEFAMVAMTAGAGRSLPITSGGGR